ncbi:MAG: hypothetical protein AB7O49_11875 [Sphingomonadales bacterium]
MPLSEPPPLRDNVRLTLLGAQRLYRWIAERQDELEISSEDSVRIAGSLLDIAVEHHAGIIALVSARIYGSAFALIRSEFEALVRALWLQLAASPKELKTAVENDSWPRFTKMIEAIECHPDFSEKILSGLKASAWTAMNGYTHGGMHQIVRRMTAQNTIEPNYDPDEVLEVLKASGSIALLAFQQMARLAQKTDLENEIEKMLVTYS